MASKKKIKAGAKKAKTSRAKSKSKKAAAKAKKHGADRDAPKARVKTAKKTKKAATKAKKAAAKAKRAATPADSKPTKRASKAARATARKGGTAKRAGTARKEPGSDGETKTPPAPAKRTRQPSAKTSARSPRRKSPAKARPAAAATKATKRRSSKTSGAKARRAVMVAACRTPFVRSFGALTQVDTIGLGAHAVQAMLERSGVSGRDVDSIVWGGVILPTAAPNVGREIALDLQLPSSVEAMTVTRACTSGLQAVTLAVAAIERGECDVVIAGGSDSTSNAPINLPQRAVHALAPIAFGKAKTAGDYLRVLDELRPLRGLMPTMPKIAERTTGEVMGESAERMAQRHQISREAQDELALASHHRAAAAIASGRFEQEVAPLTTEAGKRVATDDIVRADTSLEKLARLRPAFAKDGTVSAGNASALTDGAAATLWMDEDKAKELGLEPIACMRSWSYVGVDPSDQLLIGPALAMPKALRRAGLGADEIDLFDLHEAFAAQVLAVLSALESGPFARLHGFEPMSIAASRLNVHGGSIALGHPFAATGARMVMTMANELKQTGKQYALLGICAAGGLGGAAVLERVA